MFEIETHALIGDTGFANPGAKLARLQICTVVPGYHVWGLIDAPRNSSTYLEVKFVLELKPGF